MNPLMLPDYFDGTKPTQFNIYQSIKNIKVELNDLFNEVDFSYNTEISPVELETFQTILKARSGDSFLHNYYNYINHGKKNYVFSNPLIDTLRTVPIDISYNHLPEEIYGYIDRPKINIGEFPILGVFFSIKSRFNKKLLFVSFFVQDILDQSGNFDPGHFFCQWEEGDKLSDFDSAGNNEVSRTIINMIVYLSSNHPDFTFEKNEVPTKSGKKKYFKEHFTPKDWIFVGKNFHTKHLKRGPLKCGEFEVRGHYRWQACGPRRSQHELIWINPFTKRGE